MTASTSKILIYIHIYLYISTSISPLKEPYLSALKEGSIFGGFWGTGGWAAGPGDSAGGHPRARRESCRQVSEGTLLRGVGSFEGRPVGSFEGRPRAPLKEYI